MIFISYRRADSEDFCGRLYDRLAQTFGRKRVFMDVDTIKPSSNFENSITEYIGDSNVMLVVIGPLWAAATDEAGHRRLADPA